MNENEWKTAEQLMSALEKDPSFVKRREAKAEKFRRLREKYAQLDKPILDALAAIGYHANSLEDIVSKLSPLPSTIVEILLTNLQTCEDVRQIEGIVRALGAAEEPFDGKPLCRVYEAHSDQSLRFAIANTIALAKPHSIENWLLETAKDPWLREKLEDLGFELPIQTVR